MWINTVLTKHYDNQHLKNSLQLVSYAHVIHTCRRVFDLCTFVPILHPISSESVKDYLFVAHQHYKSLEIPPQPWLTQ